MRTKIWKELKKRQEKSCDTVDSSVKGDLPTTGKVYVRLGTKGRHSRRKSTLKFRKEKKSMWKTQKKENCKMRPRRKKSNQNVDEATNKYVNTYVQAGKETNIWVLERERRGERTALAKKGRAGCWQNCNLWPPAGWKGLFYLVLVSIRACNTSSPIYKAEKAYQGCFVTLTVQSSATSILKKEIKKCLPKIHSNWCNLTKNGALWRSSWEL